MNEARDFTRIVRDALQNTSRIVPYGVEVDMICAGDPKGDWPCPGDLDAPLQIIYNMERPVTGPVWISEIVGVTSFGEPCGSTEFPSVYTWVPYYLDWVYPLSSQGSKAPMCSFCLTW